MTAAPRQARPRLTRPQKDAIVRRLRRWKATFGLLVLLVAASTYCSHATALPDPRPLDGQRVAVHEIIDGDTLLVRIPDGQIEKVRMKGIDAPELPRDGKPGGHFAWEAKHYLNRRTDGQRVILQFDGTTRRDRYGRLLAFVFLSENQNVNLELVRNGYAYADRRFDSYLDAKLGQAEAEARKAKAGLWKEVTTEQMPEWRQAWLKRRGQPASP